EELCCFDTSHVCCQTKPVTSKTMSQDGFLHFGDTVVLVNSAGGEHAHRGSCVLSIIADSRNIASQSDTNSVPHLLGPLQVGGAHSMMTPCVRNAFIITSVDGTSDGEVLRYDQSFALRTTAGFAGEVNKQMELSLVEEFDFLCWWKVIYVHTLSMKSFVLISHCKTNQCLAALGNHILWTLFGKAYKLTAHTILNSHKAEWDNNHWLFFMAYPANQNQSLMQLQQDSDTTDEQREKQEDTQIKKCS
uniref:Cilia and flagella associated protein 161 n=1 Tax=Sinocyclocheilus grahami TaxID=75366 RepID=A0A672PHD8_SINGR